MPINCNRVVGRHETAFDVVVDGRRRALPGIANAGAAWCQHHQPVVRRHLLKAFSTQLLAGLQADIAGLAVLAAIATTWRMIDAVECRQDVERRIDAAADLDDLAEAAAGAPRPAGIRTQLLAPEDQRRLRLGDLDRRAAHAAGIGSRRQPVPREARAGAAL